MADEMDSPDVGDERRDPTNHGRRRFIGGLTIGAGAAAGAITGAAASMVSSGGWRRERVEFEVAVLGHTWRDSTANWSESESDFRGMPFQVEGTIYPAGALPEPSDGFVPTDAGAIGHWFCRGNTLVYADRLEPHVTSTQEFIFGMIKPDDLFAEDVLTTSGIEGTETRQVAHRPVVGGTGRYLGATGAQAQVPTGANTTLFSDGFGNALNLRMTFDLFLPDF